MVRSKRIESVRQLYYITHIDNLGSILDRGILSHGLMDQKGLPYTRIYDKLIVSRRKEMKAPDGKSLWSFSNLYFNARNPMLYRVCCETNAENIVILEISPSILESRNILITDGNAASEATSFFSPTKTHLSKIFKQTQRKYWNPHDGSKRRMMAECLVPDSVPPDFIMSIFVPSYDAVDRVKEKIEPSQLGNRSVMCEPYTFFEPSKVIPLLPHLFIKEGDMFFSRYQTLTVSVNRVGVMGKGVASRAKWQFSDVYVHYQNACRKGYLRMGKPYLYKREYSTDFEFADDPTTLKNYNAATWFLLFATKKHWRDRSDINAIEKGLQWIVKNYKDQGIKALALPALGCGLGRLYWEDVGPLLCKYMAKLDIPVSIYLPLEKQISNSLLTREFLLPNEQARLS
jgi:hypothetical protein